MVDIEKKYHKRSKRHVCVLKKKHTKDVSPIWKILHVSVFFAVAGVSLAISVYLFLIFQSYQHACILYAEVKYVKTQDNTTCNDTTIKHRPNVNSTETLSSNLTTDAVFNKINKAHHVSPPLDKWLCDFVLFIPLFSVIVGIIFGVIFALCSRGGKGYSSDLMSRPQNLAYPVIILSFVFSLLNALSWYHFYAGMQIFCYTASHEYNIFEDYEDFECTEEIDEMGKYFHTPDQPNVPVFSYYRLMDPLFALVIFLWILQLSITVLRVVLAPDYQGYVISRQQELSGHKLTVRFKAAKSSSASSSEQEEETLDVETEVHV